MDDLRAIATAGKLKTITDETMDLYKEFDLDIDYGSSFVELIESCGCDQVHPWFIEFEENHRQVGGKCSLKLALVGFQTTQNRWDVEPKMASRGYRAATPMELMAFCAKFPEEQRKFPILGLMVRGHIRNCIMIPMITGDADNRSLDLHHDQTFQLGAEKRYLAVKEAE